MQIDRSPRRIHGRAFLTEILIIVIGVLIALAAGQLVEDWNWHRKVAQGDQQLQRDARLNFLYAAEQVAAKPCLQAQLRTLRDRVLSSGTTLQPAPVHHDDFSSGFVFRTPSRPYGHGVWQSLIDDGTTSHMQDDRREILGSAYGSIDILNHLADETDLMTGRLMVLSHALPLDAGTRATLIASLEEQQARSELQSLVAAQLLGSYRDLGASVAAGPDLEALGSGTLAFCRKQGVPLQDWAAVMRAQPPAID